MPLWLKMKVFAPIDKISNPGTKYQLIDGKKQIVDEKGLEPLHIRKGQFIPINVDWEDYLKAKKVLKRKKEKADIQRYVLESKEEFFDILGRKLDPDVFEFFRIRSAAQKKVEKERPLLKKLPEYKLQKKRQRVQEKKDNSRFGTRKPSIEEIRDEAKQIGVDMPVNRE